MIEIVIATRNPKKLRELKALLAVPFVRWRSLNDLPHVPNVNERGRTFTENTIAKARAVARATGRFAIADDSGLEVDVLNGAPGVRSARFAGRHGDDRANYTKLLRLLQDLSPSRRQAQFRCVLALASPLRLLALTKGVLVGRIATAPRGRYGFGYDPVFIVPRLNETVAQLTSDVKNRISHRAKAAAQMRRVLERMVRHQSLSATTRRVVATRKGATG